ncbi:MAG: Crp/Fnr family transcriptional regulator [Chitinophagales bacterium]|nr:Crp/Fnr family transcriptional regulator [Chitinophagales bacterium]
MKLHEYISLNYEEGFRKSDIPFEVIQRKVKKGTVIHAYSEVVEKMYFLNQGIVETTISFGEKEKTLSFYFQHSFFSAFASAMTGEPSRVQSTAITDCIYEEYSFKDYQRACETSLLLNKIGRMELEKSFMIKNQREMDFLTKTKEEMYLDLIAEQPEILQHIPLKKIANYFGILPETLSRIRKRIIS